MELLLGRGGGNRQWQRRGRAAAARFWDAINAREALPAARSGREKWLSQKVRTAYPIVCQKNMIKTTYDRSALMFMAAAAQGRIGPSIPSVMVCFGPTHFGGLA
jgi:hypothetical protein